MMPYSARRVFNRSAARMRRTILPAVAVVAVFAMATLARSQETGIRVYGPIVTWHVDPTTTANITWVESPHAQEVAHAGKWREGRSGFGFGDDDDRTDLAKKMAGKFTRIYIRREFEVDDVEDHDNVTLQIRYDDGFIAYLNGKEVARGGIASGRGPTARGLQSHEAEDEFESIEIQEAWKKYAREGDNVLAVEGHNRSATSSDMTLDVYLTESKSRSSDEIIKEGAKWYYMCDGDAPRGWVTVYFDPEKDPDEESEGYEPQTLVLRSAETTHDLYLRRAGQTSWDTMTAAERPFGDTEDRVRTVALTGLAPATVYEFGVRQQPDGTGIPILKFQTAPAELTENVRFVTGGDMGSTKTARDMNRLAASLRPLFALLGGDLAYANGKNLKAWHNWLDSWRFNAIGDDGMCVPMILAIGNHETGSGLSKELARELNVHPDAQFFYSLFTLPDDKPYYVVDFGDYLSVVVLDSDHSWEVKKQTAFLKRVLSQRRSVPHRFVCYHRPTWGTAKSPNMNVRKYWVPLFERYRVSAVFENDHHTLKRTHLLKQGKVDPDGILYLGDGAWGVGTRDVPKPGERDYLAHAQKVNHLWLVTLQGNQATYVALDKGGNELDRVPE